jgi:hypothetical protein
LEQITVFLNKRVRQQSNNGFNLQCRIKYA